MIKRIQATNFISWPLLDYMIPSGVTLIRGYNYDDKTAEACGKSSLLNAISWCLFGQIPKDAKIDDVIRLGEKSCSVKVELNNGIIVERSRKPNDLILWKDGIATRGKDMKDTQRVIENTINLTYETFLQAIYFAQNSQVKFLLLNEEGKGKILSQLGNCDLFDTAKRKAIELNREYSLKLTIEQNRSNELKQGIKLYADQINSLRDIRLKFENERHQTIGMLELKRDDIKRQIETNTWNGELTPEYYEKLKELKTTYKTYQNTQADLRVQLGQQSQKQMQKQALFVQIESLKKDIASASSDDNHCDTCGSKLQSDTIKSYIESKTRLLEQKQQEYHEFKLPSTEKLQSEYDFYVKATEEIANDLKAVETIELEITHKKEKMQILKSQFEQCLNDINTQKTKEYPDIDKRIELLQASLFQKQQELQDVSQKIADYCDKQLLYESLKDGFKQVKLLSFHEILNDLNRRVNYYLSELFEQPISIDFTNISDDNNEAGKITTNITFNGELRPLGLFSGGQTRRIMLAVDLAISDLLHGANDSGRLLILDEYFKDLSEESMHKIIDLLTKFHGSVLLIEHNSLLHNMATNSVFIEYRNGLSDFKKDDTIQDIKYAFNDT